MTPVATAGEALAFAVVMLACLLALAVVVDEVACDGGACVEVER